MKKRIFVLLAVFVLLLVSVIPSFAYYDEPDTDIKIGGLWYLPESWDFTDSYELRFAFYSSQSGQDDVLDIHYSGIYIDAEEQTIEYITTLGGDTHHTVYMNGAWLGDGYRQVIMVDFIADTADPGHGDWVQFAYYLRDNALDVTVFNYEMAKEFSYQEGYDEGYQEGLNSTGGFTQDDLDNAASEGYWSGYEEGSDAGYLAGVDAGFQKGYDAAVSDIDFEGLFQAGYDEGKIEGYQLGKRDHETYEMDIPVVFDSIFHGIAGLMIDTLSWEIFGINVLGTMMAILLVSILAWVITKVL